MNKFAPVDYALAFDPCVVFVARALDAAAPAAVSIETLTRTYQHSNGADFYRIKLHEHLEDNFAATAWLVRRAVAYLDKWVTMVDDQVAYKEGKGLADVRLHDGSRVEREGPDPNEKLRDPFNPLSGAFSDNIRHSLGDLTELRESMKEFGWVAEFPALLDERGVVLVGHRRITVAKELGIEPVTKVLHLGTGDFADAQRFRLAITSNLGGRPLSVGDRRRLAAYLCEEQEWSQQRIAEALNVSQMTVSRDLGGLNTVFNPKRGGRPRKNAPRPPGVKQAQRSVDAKPEEWKQFREIAEAEGTSAADKLGELVRASIGGQPLLSVPRSPAEFVPDKAGPRICPTCGQPLKGAD